MKTCKWCGFEMELEHYELAPFCGRCLDNLERVGVSVEQADAAIDDD